MTLRQPNKSHRARSVLALVLALIVLAAIGFAVAVLVDSAISDARAAARYERSPAACHTRPCWRRVHRARARRVCLHRHGRRACAFRARYRDLAPARRAYVAALMECEAGVPYNRDGSAFILRAEWAPSTWVKAGGTLGVIPSYWEEAVRVSRWLDRVGFHVQAGWPNCP